MRVVNQIFEDRWEEFVSGNPCANIFHSPEMFQVFSRTEGFEPGLWAVIDSDNQILALFLPVHNTILDKPLLRFLTTRTVAYGSVLCQPGEDGNKALSLLLRSYSERVRRSTLFTELRNLSDLSGIQSIGAEHGFDFEGHLNFLIDLKQPSTEIWKNIRSNARRNIRKARKSHVVIEEVDNLAGISTAYEILRIVYKRIEVPLPHESLFVNAFNILHSDGMFRVLLAKVEGKEIGVLTLLLYKGIITYWYTGVLKEHFAYRASDMLVWSALELGQEAGCHTFDFGGGGRPDEPYGVRDFKAKFGGNLVNYGRNIINHAPLRLKISETVYQLVKHLL